MDSLISIIVPVYNVEMYLEECIKSLIKQTYNKIEIILVNDGSTDNSPLICDKYKKMDDRIKVINKSNSGVSNTRNVGIENANGEFVCFVDSDDYVCEDYVEYLISLVYDDECDVVLTKKFYTSFHPNDESSRFNDDIKIISGEIAKREILEYKYPIGVYCKLFRKSFLDLYQIRFEEELVIGEGFNFNTYAFQFAKKVVTGIKKIYFYRRTNPNSVTTNFNPLKWENGIYAIRKIKENDVFKNKTIKKAICFAEWHTNRDVIDFMLVAKQKKNNIDLYKKCRKTCKKLWYYPFLLKVGIKEKIRAICVLFFPKLIPYIMRKRYLREMEESNG